MRCARLCMFLLPLALSLSSCSHDEQPLRVAEQYGLAYAPVTIARELGFVEEALAELDHPVDLQWLRLGNTATIREAAVAGRVDAAFIGIPPFLISRAGGMDWKIAGGLNQSPLGLVTWREDLNNISDFDSSDRIALPQPGSIQHILLAMASRRLTGDAAHFDRQLVTMNHPDGMQALLARREIAAHFTSPPYLFLELEEPGMKQVVSGRECFGGPFTFIVTVATKELAEERPKVLAAFMDAVDRGMAYLHSNPEKSAALLAPIYQMDSDDVLDMLGSKDLDYSRDVVGIEEFVSFMKDTGYLPADFNSGGELFWTTAVLDSGTGAGGGDR
ncbi:ABC transporter substrate-binding protein [Sediminispirochaeta bajacaliforniensis]|uniref:ABC transporter substrate-binding protein n=1 Tax=Sediminispirochaeta bajacaliforniensis TaxID=148 RepID=UPI000368A50F|nr:ABC transporter substrate-binding protein [Sediminispirochaeta bajacaliforniensis]